MIFSATRYKGFNEGMLWEPPANQEELLPPLDRNIDAWKSGKGYAFTIVETSSDTPLGRISIRQTDKEQVWDVGFWTHPASQGQGVMTEVLERVLQFGFEELNAQSVEACHATWNLASEKVLTRNGMVFVKHLEQGFQKKGEWVAENQLSISREAWRNLRK